MTDRRDEETDEEESERTPAPARKGPEGVRILGAEEAQAAMDAGTVGKRLGDSATRYGDVPPRPDPAIRPAVRFPRTADDEVPDVVAKPTPDDADSESGATSAPRAEEDPATPDQEDLWGSTEPELEEESELEPDAAPVAASEPEDELEATQAIDLAAVDGDDIEVGGRRRGRRRGRGGVGRGRGRRRSTPRRRRSRTGASRRPARCRSSCPSPTRST